MGRSLGAGTTAACAPLSSPRPPALGLSQETESYSLQVSKPNLAAMNHHSRPSAALCLPALHPPSARCTLRAMCRVRCLQLPS